MQLLEDTRNFDRGKKYMSFIAGYLTRKDKLAFSLLEEKVKLYPVLIGEESDSYEDLIVETPFGHIIQKYKKNYPINQHPSQDGNGNLLVRLGFFYISDSINDNETLLERCVRNSPKTLEECEGEFVFIFSERHSRELHIVNDRFASRPFYTFQDRDYIYFSSNLAFLLYLAHSTYTLDILGWLQIFSYAHTCGTRTTIRDIKRLSPGTHLTLSPDGILEKQYWCLKHEPETDLDPIAYGMTVFEALQAGTALRAKLVGKGVVALSGGLDSRLVAAGLPKDVDFSAFTFVDATATSSTIQTKAAAEVCKSLGLSHRIQPIAEQKFSQVASDVIRLTGGLRPLHHMAIVMLYIDEIRRRGLTFLLGGGPGDVLAGSYIPSVAYLDPSRVDMCIRDFCRKRAAPTNHLTLLFHDDILREYSPDVYVSLLASFANISGPTAAHRVTAWAMMYRQPAFTFTSLIHNHPDVTEAFSHLDYTYCDLMLRLPADWLYKENFYTFMIYNSLPQLRYIIYANTGNLLPSELMHIDYRQSLSKRTMLFIDKISREFVHQIPSVRKLLRLIRSKIVPPTPPPFYYSLLRNDAKLLTEIVECLQSYTALKEVLDTKKCLRFVDNFKAGNLQETELLGGLATMCLSFKHLNLST